ncbi:MAG: glycosyl hydrolase 53 family protein [Paludibacteraceae bacterium]|nr:glycosyl hydrolase 53 family protein [Paludibacteraceae bacterium]MBQ2520367.1 glycosyl hydrolase 53 family protein [Paludibacteraceae bacterium]MBQ5378575.1 glycosyl hydrolase 53 family protein [Paludibacteraceae bacterium]
MKKQILLITLLCMLLTACYHRTDSPRGSWAKGCDLSWLSEMEHDGVLFYEQSADSLHPSDCIDLLRANGMNAVRLRVWVNHSTGWSNKEDMLYLAERAAKKGQRILLDIHYSDFFADPHRQDIPAGWRAYDYDHLCEAVREYTFDVLYALKEKGIKPEWVQIGNETPNGMLWPVGKVSDQMDDADNQQAWDRYAGFTRIGYEAAKEAFPDITVIVHVDNAYEYRDWFWQAMKAHGGKWDMIGLSHYPMMAAWSGKTWQEMNDLAEHNVQQLIREFHSPVMICEVGMMNYGEGAVYDSVAAVSEQVMADFVHRMERIDSCAGIFYWEPEVYGGWRPQEYIPLGWGGYDMGSFTPDGSPSPALNVLLSSQHE